MTSLYTHPLGSSLYAVPTEQLINAPPKTDQNTLLLKVVISPDYYASVETYVYSAQNKIQAGSIIVQTFLTNDINLPVIRKVFFKKIQYSETTTDPNLEQSFIVSVPSSWEPLPGNEYGATTVNTNVAGNAVGYVRAKLQTGQLVFYVNPKTVMSSLNYLYSSTLVIYCNK